MKKMTDGPIIPQVFLFSLPLILGSILQLTYNLFDFVILGWFSSEPITAQASLSIAGPIFNIFISLISGLCVGFAIHSGQLFGEGDTPSLRKQFTSCLIVFGVFSLLLTLLFNVCINPIMLLANVRDATLKHEAVVYLGVTSLGFAFSFLYNLYASFLRSLGDSLASLIFLALSCVINIGLNILFVVSFKLDVVGVALATVISQAISAIAIIVYGKLRCRDVLIFKPNEYRIDWSLLKTSSSYAVASAMQQIVLYVGKFIISTQVNAYDAYTIAAFGGATKIDNFVFAPTQNFGHASSIFMAQNRGAGKKDRYKKGFFAGLGMSWIYGILISIIIYFVRYPLLNMFISSETVNRELVIASGMTYLGIMSFFYIMPATTNSLQSFFRGLGKLQIVFLSTFIQIVFRVIAMIVLIKLTDSPMESAAYATVIGWGFMIAFELPCLVYRWRHLDNYFSTK